MYGLLARECLQQSVLQSAGMIFVVHDCCVLCVRDLRSIVHVYTAGRGTTRLSSLLHNVRNCVVQMT